MSSFSVPHTFSFPKARTLPGHGLGASQGLCQPGLGSTAGATAGCVQMTACPVPVLLPEVMQKEKANPNGFKMVNSYTVCGAESLEIINSSDLKHPGFCI